MRIDKQSINEAVDITHSHVVSGKTSWRHKYAKPIFVMIGILALVVVGATAYVLTRPDHIDPPKAVDISDVGDDYSLMTPEQVTYHLYKETGLSIAYLQSKNKLDGKILKNYDTALEAARALAKVGDRQKALQAYAVAELKMPDKSDYEFFLEYATTAISKGDKALAKAKLQQARAIAVKLPQPTQDGARDYQESAVTRIDRLLKALEQDNE
jgi:hypothetical protein